MIKRILSLLGIGLILLSCRKEDCHKKIKVVNNSQESILVVKLGISSKEDTCSFINEQLLLSGEMIDYQISIRSCIEERIVNKRPPFPVYILDPNNNNELYFQCDSVIENNKILKELNFDLEVLRTNDFTFYYP